MAKVVIEICGKQNQSYQFSPLEEKVRGRWDSARAPQRGRSSGLGELLMAAPVIPGEYILCDLSKMEGHRFDPLRETDEGRQLWAEMEPIIRRHEREFGQALKLREPSIQKLSENGENGGILIKDWLWAMARAVHGGHARLVSGELPTFEQISAMPGRRTRDPGNTGTQRGDLQKYVDAVPPKGGKPAA